MEKLFLIGGSGFIGKNLVEHLENMYEIHVIDKFIDSVFFANHPSVHTLKLDLVEERIPDCYVNPDYVVNLASIVTAERDLSLFESLISSNFKVLMNLYDRYRKLASLKLFIQFGTSEEYGNEGSPFKESVRENPCSPYALVKQLTVNTALMLYKNYGFPVMVVRPSNLFGKYQNPSKFIPYVIGQLKQNAPLNVSPCEQKRDFIYTEDFAWCIDQLLRNYTHCLGEIVNLASGKSVSLKTIIETLKAELNSTSVVNYGAIPYRANEVMDMVCSVSKFELITGTKVTFNTIGRLEQYVSIS